MSEQSDFCRRKFNKFDLFSIDEKHAKGAGRQTLKRHWTKNFIEVTFHGWNFAQFKVSPELSHVQQISRMSRPPFKLFLLCEMHIYAIDVAKTRARLSVKWQQTKILTNDDYCRRIFTFLQFFKSHVFTPSKSNKVSWDS